MAWPVVAHPGGETPAIAKSSALLMAHTREIRQLEHGLNLGCGALFQQRWAHPKTRVKLVPSIDLVGRYCSKEHLGPVMTMMVSRTWEIAKTDRPFEAVASCPRSKLSER